MQLSRWCTSAGTFDESDAPRVCRLDQLRHCLAPAGRLAVEVAADKQRRQGGIRALAADEKVCHGVLENREAARERQFRQQAPGAAILDAERLSVYATGWRRADPGEGIEPAQQPLAVDLISDTKVTA
ncbi:hypothetical protein X771_30650 [Mesorhizobium sp. LSJC277A00]|nr:hypothetical protein X771_30650 [Mesorhizobium sp. LSJC277A00]